ncbi:MAG: hypothetical protein LBR77_04705 [Lachnospiraceae bacterium]|nr:hypothetical protein [Lachnospiraceae bacterium]
MVEVKSGNDYRRHPALDHAIEAHPDRFRRKIVLCKGNIEKGEDVTYLPLYMAMLL